MNSESSKCFIVLGMHRSATSLLAKGLNDNQVEMGGTALVANPKPDNPHGHFEDRRFIRLNNQILNAAGGAWNRPPEHQAILNLAGQFAEPIERCLSEASAGKSMWGWKDPRTVLTIDLYLPYLQKPHIFAAFRDPDEVASSLVRRNDLSIQTRNKMSHRNARALAMEYNGRLVSFLQRYYLPDQ